MCLPASNLCVPCANIGCVLRAGQVNQYRSFHNEFDWPQHHGWTEQANIA